MIRNDFNINEYDCNPKKQKKCERVYFNIPQPCTCSNIQYNVSKSVKTLLNSPEPMSYMYIYTLLGVCSVDSTSESYSFRTFSAYAENYTPNITIIGNMLNAVVDDGLKMSIPLSQVIAIEFEIVGNENDVNAFLEYLNKKYPKTNLQLSFFVDQNPFDDIYIFNINANSNSGGLTIQGRITNYDSEIAWIQTYDCDNYTNTFYFIQLSAIVDVQSYD